MPVSGPRVSVGSAAVRYVDAAEEARWVAGLRAGDATAFESIFRAYYRPLCGFIAASLSSTDAADELAQDVLVALWEGRGRLEFGAGDLGRYLFRAARNRTLNYLRHGNIVARGAALALRSDVAPGMGQVPSGPDAVVEQRELVAALERAVTRLPGRCREAYTLRWVHHLNYAEIARIMGISVKGVEIQLTRALRTLREALADFA